MGEKVLVIDLPVGAVDHDVDHFLLPIDEHVVLHRALLIQEQAVPGRAHRDRLHILADGGLEHVQSLGAVHLDPSHVRQVEQADALPDAVHLVDDGGVHHGHVETEKVDHPRAEGQVFVVYRRLLHGEGLFR